MKAVKIALVLAALTSASSAWALKEGLTREQATTGAAKKFGQINADGKGDITPAELATYMAKVAEKKGEAADAGKAERRFKKLDMDGNGSVSQAELQVEELNKFDKADANKNGKIDTAEAA